MSNARHVRNELHAELKTTCVLILFIVLMAAHSIDAASASPAILIENNSGWMENIWEDENVSIRFAVAGNSAYIRFTNKTSKVVRITWPAETLELPSGSRRTVSIIYEYETSSGYKNLGPGIVTYEILKAGSVEDLLVPSGQVIFLELGIWAEGGLLVGKKENPFAIEGAPQADSFFSMITSLPIGNVFIWKLHYDFAGNDIVREIKLKVGN